MLDAVEGDQKKNIVETLLQHCVISRALLTPEDAVFCAKYFELLHSLGVDAFSSLQYFDRVVRDVFPAVFCATDREAATLGIFLRETLSPLRRWRYNKEAYRTEASDKPGFATAIGSTSRCSFEQFGAVFGKWYDKIFRMAKHCLENYRAHGRAGLIVLIKIVPVFPVLRKTHAALVALVQLSLIHI